MTKEVFIKDVMAKPTTIAKSAKITEALDKMLDAGLDPLIAVNNNTVVGTVSRQAIAEKLGSKQNSGIAPTAIHVASVVEEDFTSVYPDESINVLIPLLQQYKLVVVYDAEHKLIGQVSAGDLLKKYQPTDGLAGAIEKTVTIEADERVGNVRR
ncbi:CBS domain-containing protein, partial [Methanoregula sp.]|uniref:CBS domain-containing protein n=1 Tax=Methanoregula sp. TaxID=2052170 RepID=UPI000CB0A835